MLSLQTGKEVITYVVFPIAAVTFTPIISGGLTKDENIL